MTAQSWIEQGRRQWRWQTWGKAHEASVLHRELQATEESWEWENRPSSGTAHRLAVQGQTVGPENIHPGNMIRTERVLFRNIYVYTYIHAVTVKKRP